MTRLSWVSVALMATAATAYAESQADIASKLNDEGKDAMYAQNYGQASAKFREAVARVPEPKYFFNLCTSLFQEGKFDEAVTACNAVGNNKPTADLQAKTDKLIGRIKDEAKTQGLELHPAGGGGGDTNVPPSPDGTPPPPTPTNPDGTTAPLPPPPADAAVGKAPEQALYMAVKPEHHYTWSLGADILGGGGKIGADNAYGKTFVGVRLKGDYVLNSAQRIGVQGYLQFSQFGSNTDAYGNLQIIDIGVAAYKHFCAPGVPYLCLTPLIGIQASLFAPSHDPNSTDGEGTTFYNYSAFGARAELNAEFAFGRRQENVIGVMVGLNAYTKVLAGPSGDTDGMAVGLDSGGAAFYIGLGYAYRFNTPLGGAAFVTLE